MVVGPGESTEIAFRREVRGSWFAWLAAHDEGDAQLARTKLAEILTHARKIGLKRLSDISLSATLVARRDVAGGRDAAALEALDAAVELDPDLPEARWARARGLVASRSWGSVPGAWVQALRAGLADGATRRVLFARTTLLGVFSVAATGLALVLLMVGSGIRRAFHDAREISSRILAAPADALLGAAFLGAPLFLSFDPVWIVLWLFVLTIGYATRKQQLAAACGLAVLFPVPLVLDRVAFDLALGSSPFVRGAEALRESRYDQRVLDDLEAVRNVLPADPDVRFLLGCLYQALGQNDRAVAEYTMGAQSSATESRCLVNRGDIRFVDGDFGSAQEDFQEAVKREPRNISARYNLSLVLAETFRTVEAGQALQEARALDARLVQRFQDSPRVVKVASEAFGVGDAEAKVEALSGTASARRFLGHFRTFRVTAALKIPVVAGGVLALALAVGLDFARLRGRGYALACTKCGRTYCRLCKPPGESPLLCSQCVHVYLRKGGVSIETKLQKLDEVNRFRSGGERRHGALNWVLPGSRAFLEGWPQGAVAPLIVFFVGVLATVLWASVVVVPRPGTYPSVTGRIPGLVIVAAGVALGQRRSPQG